jgi:hypothetical protein
MTGPAHLLAASAVLSGVLFGQAAPSVNEDPSHKRLLYTAHLRMFDVTLAPGGSTLDQGGGGESEFRMETPGRWFPSQWDQPHTLTLVGRDDAHVVEVEAR